MCTTPGCQTQGLGSVLQRDTSPQAAGDDRKAEPVGDSGAHLRDQLCPRHPQGTNTIFPESPS